MEFDLAKIDAAKLVVAEWNRAMKVGDSVAYEKSAIEGKIIDKVAGAAFVLGDAAAVELERIGFALFTKTEPFFG